MVLICGCKGTKNFAFMQIKGNFCNFFDIFEGENLEICGKSCIFATDFEKDRIPFSRH